VTPAARVGVKICGVNSADAIDAAAEAGADWVGFVFLPRSPRAITPAEAAALSARVTGGPQRVGLFVEPSDEDIAAALAGLPLDVLQVYASEARVAGIAARFALPVWRAIGVTAPLDLPGSAGAATALLIEPNAAPGASRPGGNGTSMDWRMLGGWQPGFDWLLAGGLTPSNVAQAVAESGAPAVDVSSGVETAPGMKSRALILAFVAAARGA